MRRPTLAIAMVVLATSMVVAQTAPSTTVPTSRPIDPAAPGSSTLNSTPGATSSPSSSGMQGNSNSSANRGSDNTNDSSTLNTGPARPAAPPAVPAPRASADGFLTGTNPDQMLASGMIGSYVYGPANETIGDINDFVLDRGGSVTAAIIGVGGFLGIGEKNVAVTFSQLKPTERDGRTYLVLNLTKDQLQGAPAFDRQKKS